MAANRSYNILLPASEGTINLADIAPADPSKGNYVLVQGPPGPPGVVQSVNGKSAASINLTAADVNALPNNTDAWLRGGFRLDGAPGTTRDFSITSDRQGRWAIQVDGTPESGNAAGSNLWIRSRSDDGGNRGTVLYADRASGNVGIGNGAVTTAKQTVYGAQALTDVQGDPATVANAVQFYSKSGKPYVQQGDGTVYQLGAAGTGGGAVQSVNQKTGAVTLTYTDVQAMAAAARGVAGGVASLDTSTHVPIAQIPDLSSQYVEMAESESPMVSPHSTTAAASLPRSSRTSPATRGRRSHSDSKRGHSTRR